MQRSIAGRVDLQILHAEGSLVPGGEPIAQLREVLEFAAAVTPAAGDTGDEWAFEEVHSLDVLYFHDGYKNIGLRPKPLR